MIKKPTLICLPFAGGNRYSYRSLFKRSNSTFDSITLEYPGRGSRFLEDLVSDIHLLIEDLYNQIKPVVTNGEYAIYGHSLGGLIAYLLTLKVLQNKHRAPKHVFVTGAAAPSAASRTEKVLHLYPQQEFINEVVALGGIPDELIKEKEMIVFLEPIIRNDFKTSATYLHKYAEPLNVPLTVITGTEESITESDILLWQNEFLLQVDFIKMPGDHFFIYKHENELVKIISKKLQPFKFKSHG